MGFKWTYFTTYYTLIINILTFGFLIWAGIDEEDIGLFLFGIAAPTVGNSVTFFFVQRHRWARVVSKTFSLNPLWMFHQHLLPEEPVGRGFQAETSSFDGQMTGELLQKPPKDMRLAIFAAVSWGACVPSYVFLFRPYGGYMRDDDTLRPVGVVITPIVVGFALFLSTSRSVIVSLGGLHTLVIACHKSLLPP